MNKKIKLMFLSSVIVLFGFITTVHASLNIEITVDVPANCVATDTDGIIHNYGGSYLAICAFEEALSNGSVSGVQFSNQYPSMGLFVTKINGVTADPNSQYWAIYQNTKMADFGVTQLPVVAGNTILFQLNDFSDNNLGDQITIHINSLIPPVAPSGSGPLLEDIPKPIIPPEVSTQSTNPANEINTTPSIPNVILVPLPKITFDTKKAFEFLSSQQKDNGSFGEDLYTDWSALAFASGNNQNQTIKLIKYFGGFKITGTLLTDYERHAMALMALGLNPYNTNSENYIKKITDSFDGKQFGDINEDNDDIFALIVLQNAGFTQTDKIIIDDISFILSKQKTDGSWDGSVDMTSAGIEAFASFGDNENIKIALEKAKDFLKQKQEDTGGWGNVSSTSWVIEGILALNEKPENWIKGGNTPVDYLALNQDKDGGMKDENIKNKIWETAYTLTALSGKTWNQIMQKFEKPVGPIIAKVPIKIVKKQEIKKILIPNEAVAIKAIDNIKTPEKIVNTAPQKNWFERFFGRIFGF